MNSRRNATDWICRIIVLCSVLVTLYPVIFVSQTSLKATSEFYSNIWGIPKDFAWSNYYSAWVSSRIGVYFRTSVIVVGTSVFMILVFGALAGYALSRLRVPYVSACGDPAYAVGICHYAALSDDEQNETSKWISDSDPAIYWLGHAHDRPYF